MKRKLTIYFEKGGKLTVSVMLKDNNDLKNAAIMGQKYGSLGEIKDVIIEAIPE